MCTNSFAENKLVFLRKKHELKINLSLRLIKLKVQKTLILSIIKFRSYRMSHKEMIFPTKLQHRQKFCPALLEKLFRLLQWSPVFLNIASEVCK